MRINDSAQRNNGLLKHQFGNPLKNAIAVRFRCRWRHRVETPAHTQTCKKQGDCTQWSQNL